MAIHNPVDLLKQYLTDSGLSRVDSHFDGAADVSSSQNKALPSNDKYLNSPKNSVQSPSVNWNPQAAAKGFRNTSPLGTTEPIPDLPLDALSAQAFAGVTQRLIPDLATQQVYRTLAAMDGRPLDPEEVGSVMRLMADLATSRMKRDT